MEYKLKRLTILQCVGNGQGTCRRCLDNGKWNRMWMSFLYKIDGMPGCYCWDCVKDLDNKVDYIKSSDTPIYHAEYIPHLNMWRLYDPQYEQQSVAYFESKDEIPENVLIED